MNTKTCPFKFVIGEDAPPNPTSSIFAHFLSALKRYASFAGRATRKEYWSFYLFIMIINSVLGMILGSIQEKAIESYLGAEVLAGNTQLIQDALAEKLTAFDLGATCLLIAGLLVLIHIIIGIPLFGVMARRCHDVGQSSIAALISVVGGIIYSFCANFGILMWLGTTALVIAGVAGLWMLVTVFFCDSQRGTNKYGPSIKYPEA